MTFGPETLWGYQIACFFNIKYLQKGLSLYFIFCTSVKHHNWNLMDIFWLLISFGTDVPWSKACFHWFLIYQGVQWWAGLTEMRKLHNSQHNSGWQDLFCLHQNCHFALNLWSYFCIEGIFSTNNIFILFLDWFVVFMTFPNESTHNLKNYYLKLRRIHAINSS